MSFAICGTEPVGDFDSTLLVRKSPGTASGAVVMGAVNLFIASVSALRRNESITQTWGNV